jgi:roadblock/LC7 domain-containing protein
MNIMESWKQAGGSYRVLICGWQAVTVTCAKNGFHKTIGVTSMPETEDNKE